MPNLNSLVESMHRQRAAFGGSTQSIRYGTKQLIVNPPIKHTGLNLAYLATEAVRDAVERWQVSISTNLLTQSGIPASAIEDYGFGAWEIQNAAGEWEKVFIQNVSKQRVGRWLVTFARGLVDVSLVVTYQIGDGTFVTDAATGNPVEGSDSATYYAVVSQGRARAEAVVEAGLPAGRVYLEGNFTTADGEPTDMPSTLQIQKPWPAVLSLGGGLEVDGVFTVLLGAVNPWSAVEDGRGAKLQGFFISAGSGR